MMKGSLNANFMCKKHTLVVKEENLSYQLFMPTGETEKSPQDRMISFD